MLTVILAQLYFIHFCSLKRKRRAGKLLTVSAKKKSVEASRALRACGAGCGVSNIFRCRKQRVTSLKSRAHYSSAWRRRSAMQR